MLGDLGDHALLRVGTVINQKYRIERLIGAGGMASVYEAIHRNANRVAIKMLHPHLSIDADLCARFLREGYVANTVGHRGAVRVLDDDVAEDGAVFLVMELLEGETLDARRKSAGGRLPEREVCEHARQLLEVLAAAHAKGIVHRDIKPENLFLTGEGPLKVLDFGIARLQEAGGLNGATRTGRMLGTPAFMPPEQALGRSKQIDGQTDVYAVGATMFTLISGHFVHDAETVEEMLVHTGSRPARSVRTVAPRLAPAVARVIDRALAFQKEARWASARAMDAAIADAYRAAFGGSASRDGASQRLAAPTPRGEAARSGPRGPASGAPPAPGTGISTTGAVSSPRPRAETRPAGVPRPGTGKRVLVWGGSAVLLLALAGSAVFVATRGGEGTSVTSVSSGSATHAIPSPSPPAPAVTLVATSPMTGTPANLPMLPDAGLAPEKVAARPIPRARPVPVATTPRSARAAPSPTASPATVNCDPPYTVLANGHLQPKPECM